MLNIDNLTKTFGQTTAVSAATFRVGLGEMICLLGPSGCGKSTLLRMVAGLAPSDGGTISIDGQDVTRQPANRRPTAMVFQSHALWNHMSVAQNVGFGLRVQGRSREVIAEKVAGALRLVGLDGFDKRRPSELSGGQAQRVALARCLVVEPKVLLMDEPFSALDAHLRANLREELKLLQRRLKLTTIFVTHDQEEAMELADRIVVMNAGRIEHHGPPREVYLQPKTLFTAGFMGEINRIPVTGGLAPFGPVPVSDGTLLIRPEAIGLAGSLHIGPCKVEDAAFFGTHVRAHVSPLAASGLRLVVHLPQSQLPVPGAVLDLRADSHVVLQE
jgi:spermidine/putrescine transport system ATP-binding protein